MIRTFFALCFALMLAQPALAFETRAKAAYVIDQTTGTVLLNKNADTPLPPASMSKLMTIYMAFEAVQDGRLTMDTKLPVSAHAMSYGGSTMFLNTRDRVRVEDLLRGMIVLSGNDACAVIAEALSTDGSEPGFARMMTRRAKRLGMDNSTFMNASGWPVAGHRQSMRDLAILADHLIKDFPTFYPLFHQREFLFDGRAPANTKNRNPLLGLGIGADGLKTGHTNEAGYGLVGSAKQGDRRIIFVLTGLDSAAARASESERLVNWAFRQFAMRDVAKAGDELAQARVWMGRTPTVGLTVPDDLRLLYSVADGTEMTTQITYNSPLPAPIAAGDILGELIITQTDLPQTRLPLVAAEDVARGGFMARMRTAVVVLGRLAGVQLRRNAQTGAS